MAIRPAIGELRDKITIKRKTRVQNDFGDSVETLTVLASDVHARVQPVKGQEQVRADRLSGIQNYEITLRKPSGYSLTADDVIEHAGKAMNVKWTDDLEGRNRFISVLAEAGGLTQ